MIQDIRNIRNQYAGAQEKVKSEMFRRVYVVMRAFSNREGIYVSLIAQTYGKIIETVTLHEECTMMTKAVGIGWMKNASMMITSEIVTEP